MLFYTSSGATTSAERMRIDSSGNVGISNSSPAAKLDIVEAASTTAVKIKSGTSTNQNTHITMFNDNDGGTLALGVFGSSATTFGTITAADGFISSNQELCLNSQNASGAIKFGVGSTPTEAARIDSSGNLLVGLTSITDATSRTYGNAFSGSGSYANWTSWGSGSHTHAVFRNGTGAVGSITSTASATAYNTSSDYRLKNVDGPITNSGAYIDALKPVQGSWKADGSRFIGLIAHEVQEVSETPIATGEKDGEEMQGMDYSAPELIANLIAEIQSLRARVHALEGK